MVGHVARMQENSSGYRSLVENQKKKAIRKT
jgi:hypothetical protein